MRVDCVARVLCGQRMWCVLLAPTNLHWAAGQRPSLIVAMGHYGWSRACHYDRRVQGAFDGDVRSVAGCGVWVAATVCAVHSRDAPRVWCQCLIERRGQQRSCRVTDAVSVFRQLYVHPGGCCLRFLSVAACTWRLRGVAGASCRHPHAGQPAGLLVGRGSATALCCTECGYCLIL